MEPKFDVSSPSEDNITDTPLDKLVLSQEEHKTQSEPIMQQEHGDFERSMLCSRDNNRANYTKQAISIINRKPTGIARELKERDLNKYWGRD